MAAQANQQLQNVLQTQRAERNETLNYPELIDGIPVVDWNTNKKITLDAAFIGFVTVGSDLYSLRGVCVSGGGVTD